MPKQQGLSARRYGSAVVAEDDGARSLRYKIRDYVTEEQYNELIQSEIIRTLTGKEYIHSQEQDLMALLCLHVGGLDHLLSYPTEKERQELGEQFTRFVKEHSSQQIDNLEFWLERTAVKQKFSTLQPENDPTTQYGDNYQDVINNGLNAVELLDRMIARYAKLPNCDNSLVTTSKWNGRYRMNADVEAMLEQSDHTTAYMKKADRQCRIANWDVEDLKLKQSTYVRDHLCGIVFDNKGNPHPTTWLEKKDDIIVFLPYKVEGMMACYKAKDGVLHKQSNRYFYDAVGNKEILAVDPEDKARYNFRKIKYYDCKLLKDSVDSIYQGLQMGDSKIWTKGSQAYRDLKERVKELREVVNAEGELDPDALREKLIEVQSAASGYRAFKLLENGGRDYKTYASNTRYRIDIAASIENSVGDLLTCNIGGEGQLAVQPVKDNGVKTAEHKDSVQKAQKGYEDLYKTADQVQV